MASRRAAVSFGVIDVLGWASSVAGVSAMSAEANWQKEVRMG